LYVLALTDGPIASREAAGRFLHDVDIDGIHAVCERRNSVPPLTDRALRRQHATVIAIARGTRAVLPARFGALLSRQDLERLIRTHAQDVRRGLDDVRDRVQMTLRVLGAADERPRTRASSGREYLEERRRAALPALPSSASGLVDAVRPLTVRERQERGAPGLLVTIYHLVDVANVARYEKRVASTAGAAVLVSGPWPPFAFTPQLF
jgi:hypothetical protein